jgi:hypothetical protein
VQCSGAKHLCHIASAVAFWSFIVGCDGLFGTGGSWLTDCQPGVFGKYAVFSQKLGP